MLTIEFTDLNGRKYTNGARYADKNRALDLVRYYRRLLAKDGCFITGAIPGYGVAVNVTLVTI